jgi:hypothetical protein
MGSTHGHDPVTALSATLPPTLSTER